MTDNKQAKKSIFAMYAQDLSSVNEGVWIPLRGGAEIKIRSTSSAAYRQAYDKAASEYKVVNRVSKLSEEQAEKVFIEAIVEGLVIDWKEFYDVEGNEIKYSKTEARNLFSRKEMENLVLDIFSAAQTREVFLADVKETIISDIKKN